MTLLAATPFVLAVAVVAGAIGLWQILRMARHPPIRRRRIAALLIALACLALLAVGLARTAPATSGTVVLFTDRVEHGGPEAGDGEAFVIADAVRAAGGAMPRGAVVIPDAAWLARRGGMARLHVVGHGLDAWDWPLFGGIEVVAEPPPVDPGIASLGWPRQVTVGVRWQVEGQLAGLGPGTLRLLDPGGDADRVAVDAAGQGFAFRLGAVTRAPGRWTYRLAFQADGADQVELGTIDVWARQPTLPRVLWLEAAPGFETRHLKGWLTDAGGAMAVRSVISQNRFRFERHNLPDIDLRRIDAALLAGFDVVVAEERFLTSLGARPLALLRAAVEDGLGLLVLPDPPSDSESSTVDEPWFRLPIASVRGMEDDDEGRMTARVAWADGTLSTPLGIAAREVSGDADARPLLVDPAGRILAASRGLAAGQIGVMLIEDSYRWVLEGHPEHHRHAWSLLLDAFARPRAVPRITLPVGPLLVDRALPVIVDLASEDPAEGPPDARLLGPDGSERALAWRQDLLMPARWHTVYWPAAAGWAALRLGDGTEAWWRVQAASAWTPWQQAERQRATARQVASRGSQPSPAAEALSPKPRAIGRLGLFLLALASLAFLWVDERMAGPGIA